MEKEKGLYKKYEVKKLNQKYEVKKLTNPTKEIDAIVLEFDDPISRVALKGYAHILHEEGYEELARDIRKKCIEYEAR